MTDQIAKLRAIADFAEKYALAETINSVNGLVHGADLHVWGGKASIPVLLCWAEAMNVQHIRLNSNGVSYFMYAVGEISGAGTVTVMGAASKEEAREITLAALSDGMTPVQLVRACMVTDGDDAA